MKYLSILVLLFLTCLHGFSQNHYGLKTALTLKQVSSPFVPVIVKGETATIKNAVDLANGYIKHQSADFYAISVPTANLDFFLDKLDNVATEIPVSEGFLMMDTALIVNNVLPIHQGVAPLNQAYTGNGVVIGILDSGIYFDHEDFKNEDGSTRIKFIWDQQVDNNINPPAPYLYGQEWSWLDIDNGTCNHVEPANQFGHGTTVAGAACGNGRASGFFTGVAPESDIIAVNVEINDDFFLAHVVDAIDYVFKKADAMGKPCVINTSIGTYYGSHDGLDLSAQMIDALIEERAGRAVVAAAGNGNNINDSLSNFIPTHLSYEVTQDTNFTWFTVLSNDLVYFDLWADNNELENIHFAIANDDTTNWTLQGASEFFTVADFAGNVQDGVYISTTIINNSFEEQGLLEMYAIESFGRTHLEFLITPTNTNDFWRFMTFGSGTFDLWSSTAYQGTSNMVVSNLPSPLQVPEIEHYQLPDNQKCIVSSWQCSDKVITVANYSNQAGYYDVDSVYRNTNEQPGRIFFRSSEGPTRDNRLKPDISATGNVTLATGNLDFIATALAVNRARVAHDTLHNSNGGTSMASPIVAGAVALYLEAHPNAWWYETKEAVIQTAKLDNFTGNAANTVYGNGKLDALQMIQFQPVIGCTDSNAFNYNPDANVNDGSCVPFIFGCTDSTAFNYNEIANTDDGSCIPVVIGCMDSLAINFNPLANTPDTCDYPLSIINHADQLVIEIYPNPAQDYIQIRLVDATEQYNHATLSITNLVGQVVQRKAVHSNQSEVNCWVENLKSGIYLVSFETNQGHVLATHKLIVW